MGREVVPVVLYAPFGNGGIEACYKGSTCSHLRLLHPFSTLGAYSRLSEPHAQVEVQLVVYRPLA